MDISTILSSGLLAGLVAGLITLRTTERKIAIENITQQRQVWREKIREKCIEATSAYMAKDFSRLTVLYVEFQVLLNPEDDNDISILDTVWEMSLSNKESDLHIELSEKIALLLKHDWERAKKESKPMWFLIKEPTRNKYSNYNKKRKNANKIMNRTENTSAQN
jgi:hypothetical protein